jgi:TetR/AcrR family transcriptional repressor of mexJK operon
VTDALRAIGTRILRFLLRERSLAIHRLVIAESVRFPEPGRAFYDDGPVAGRKLPASWMAERSTLSVPEPELAAEQILSLLRSGLYMRATLGRGPEPTGLAIDAVVTAAVTTFLRAYGM